MVVEVTQSEYREERSFVDADEISELLRGIDALLAVKSNPTSFADFEATYETRGAVKITAYSYHGKINYAIEAGRTISAQRVGLGAEELGEFRAMVAKAQATLASPVAK